jgi:hypothetical protein
MKDRQEIKRAVSFAPWFPPAEEPSGAGAVLAMIGSAKS